jgi:hypothetical protein
MALKAARMDARDPSKAMFTASPGLPPWVPMPGPLDPAPVTTASVAAFLLSAAVWQIPYSVG